MLFIIAYAFGMLLSRNCLREFFVCAKHSEEGASRPLKLAPTTLAGVTLRVALASEIFVESARNAPLPFVMTKAFRRFHCRSTGGEALQKCHLHAQVRASIGFM